MFAGPRGEGGGVHPQPPFLVRRFCRLFPVDEDGTIPKVVYLKTHAALCKILRPDVEDEEMRALGDEDWDKDTNGTGVLRPEQLVDILFNFVDIWAQTTDATEYMMLLDSLHGKIADPVS